MHRLEVHPIKDHPVHRDVLSQNLEVHLLAFDQVQGRVRVLRLVYPRLDRQWGVDLMSGPVCPTVLQLSTC